MRTFVLLSCFLVCTTYACAQDCRNWTTLSSDSDTAFWYNLKKTYSRTYTLKSTECDTNEIAFSFWSNGNLFFISKSNNNLYGEVTKYVKELNAKENSNRVFKKSYPLSDEKIVSIFNLMDSSKINAIPSDKYIKDWKQGFDGIEYVLEFKQKSYYSFKTFWTPRSQENVPEALLILKFIDTLYSICGVKHINTDFDKNIPFNSWTYEGSGTGVTRITSKRKKHKPN